MKEDYFASVQDGTNALYGMSARENRPNSTETATLEEALQMPSLRETIAVGLSAASNHGRTRMPSSVFPVMAPTSTHSGAAEQRHFGAPVPLVGVVGNPG